MTARASHITLSQKLIRIGAVLLAVALASISLTLWVTRRLEGGAAAAFDGFVTTLEWQLSRFTALLNLFQFVMMALALGSAMVMRNTGYRYIFNPLARLRDGLHRVEGGDFSARVDVASGPGGPTVTLSVAPQAKPVASPPPPMFGTVPLPL